METNEIIRNNINVLMQSHGSGVLARLTGLDPSTICVWASGNRIPKLSSLLLICNSLNINLQDFVSKKLVIKYEFEN